MARRLPTWALVLLALASPAWAQGLQVRIEPAQVTARPGGQFRTVAQAEGGRPPYRFEWFVGNERTGEVNQAKVWVFSTPGTFTVRVVATDADGRRGEASATATVQAASVRVDPSGATAGPPGTRFEYLATPSGLTPPYRYDIFLEDSPVTQGTGHDGPLSFWVSTQTVGNYSVRVRVTDANGLEIWGASYCRVGTGSGGAPPPPPPPGGPPPPPPPPPGDEEIL